MFHLQLLVMGNEDTLGGFPVRQVPHDTEKLLKVFFFNEVSAIPDEKMLHNFPGGASANCAPEDGAQL